MPLVFSIDPCLDIVEEVDSGATEAERVVSFS
jgi:hypothetical protein